MKKKRMYHEARMFSVELSNKSQLLSASEVPISGGSSSSSSTGPGSGLMHGSYTTVWTNPFE